MQRGNDQATYRCIARNRHNESSERSVVVKVLGECLTEIRPHMLVPNKAISCSFANLSLRRRVAHEKKWGFRSFYVPGEMEKFHLRKISSRDIFFQSTETVYRCCDFIFHAC